MILQLFNKYYAGIVKNLQGQSPRSQLETLKNVALSRAIRTSSRNLNVDGNVNVSDPERTRKLIKNAPTLKDFLVSNNASQPQNVEVPNIPYVQNIHGCGQGVFFKIYGCQMNVNDTEIIWSILKSHGYRKVDSIEEADVVLMITCSIRDNAEQKVWNQLYRLNHARTSTKQKKRFKIGLLGCMAERLKDKILEKGKIVDVIAGPDSYKDLPRLLSVPDDEAAINVILSFDETYADVMPVRMNPDSASAFVTIMRGCDNMCTYCIVPFTRGRERSRPVDSIIEEVRQLSDQGVKEVTLLGQNVNSYRDVSRTEFFTASAETQLAQGFKTVYKRKKGGLRFSDLLDKVSMVNPEMRIRFTSPHPKDFPDEVLQLVAERPNICKSIHVPAQSGNTAVLERMRRGYTREAYIDLIHHIRDILPNVYLSSDFITGFCGETEDEFMDTISLIELVKYNSAYLFAYSMREKTTAHRRLKDDVETSVKMSRLKRMVDLYREEARKLNEAQIGQMQLILIEGESKRSKDDLHARNDGNVRVIVPNVEIPDSENSKAFRKMTTGDYVLAKITNANSQLLKAEPLYHSSIAQYTRLFNI